MAVKKTEGYVSYASVKLKKQKRKLKGLGEVPLRDSSTRQKQVRILRCPCHSSPRLEINSR